MSCPVISESSKKSGVRHVNVSKNHEGQRLDNYLIRHLKGVPKAAVYRLIRTGQVRINGRRSKPDHRVQGGDEVRIPPVRTLQTGPAEVSAAVIEQVRQAVIHRDRDYLVINKPSGMAVHSGSGLGWGLIDAVRQAWPEEFFELAHRIDRETSGCIVVARNGKALQHLSGQFRAGTVVKKYLCLLNGQLKEARVLVDAPLLKNRQAAEHAVEVDEDGKPARTQFTVLQVFSDSTYAEAEIFTGRTHQIRAHAAHIDMPLAGDPSYGNATLRKKWKSRGLNRLFLHAHQLSFQSPSGAGIDSHAGLPQALREVLDRLEA